MASPRPMAPAGDGPDPPELPRRTVLSLNLLSQIQVVKQVQKHAAKLESDYMTNWLDHQLSVTNKELAESLNIRKPEVDTEAVVMKFKSIEADLLRKKREELEKRRKQLSSKRAGKRSGRRPAPYKKQETMESSDEKVYMSLRPKMVEGIPEGIQARDYIEYRKCKYIEDIKQIRSFLAANLNPGIMNDLMSTMYNMAQYNNKHEHGLLTLQAMLMTSSTLDFRIASSRFHRNFVMQGLQSQMLIKEQMASMETRIGTTILHYTLLDGQKLTHVSLEKCCCDSVLKVIADVAPNLRYLNVAGSVVTDQGLLYLCGVEKNSGRMRPQLSRECKIKSPKQDKLVLDEMPKWEKKRIGCEKLVHFEGESLLRLDWPGQAVMKYFDHPTVPLDAAFVAMLLFMPKLTSFVTDVGGRVIQAWAKVHAKTKAKSVKPRLNLEMISECHLTPPLLELIKDTCPNLTRLRVDWYEFFTQQAHSREDWVTYLPGCKNLSELHVADIDFKTNKLSQIMPDIGSNLTVIRLRELWKFKYSNFRTIKVFCPNLVVFSVVMTTKNVVTTINHIVVDKDHNLQLNGNEKAAFHKLQEFHLVGPFGNDVVRYLIKGADDLKCLTLGIEWLDPAFCDNQPLNRKDLIGSEYLTELLATNKMQNLEEIHLMAQYRRGRQRLVKACAELILEKFPKIRHIGNFQFWNLSPPDLETIVALVRSANRDILFDEDLFTCNFEPSVFECKYIENRHKLSCKNIILKKDSSNFLSDFFDVLAGPPELMDDDNLSDDEDGEDDDDLSVEMEAAETTDEEDEEDEDDFIDAVNEGDEDVFGDLEPACVIM